MANPNDAPQTRTITMSEFQWGQLDLMVRSELRKHENDADFAIKAPDRRVAAARAEDIRTMQQALRDAVQRVAVTLAIPDAKPGEKGQEVIARFATIAEAEDFLATSATIDPDRLEAGDYGIDPPEEMC